MIGSVMIGGAGRQTGVARTEVVTADEDSATAGVTNAASVVITETIDGGHKVQDLRTMGNDTHAVHFRPSIMHAGAMLQTVRGTIKDHTMPTDDRHGIGLLPTAKRTKQPRRRNALASLLRCSLPLQSSTLTG